MGADHWHPDNAATRRQQAVDSHQVLSSLQSRYGLTTVSGVDTNDYGPTEGQAIAAMRVKSRLNIERGIGAGAMLLN